MNTNTWRVIEPKGWKREKHYALYASATYPYVGITTQLDITALREDCRARKRNFFTAFLFTVMRAMNSLENFRYRIVDGSVGLYDRIDPNFTVFDADDELFYFAEAGYVPDYAAFAAGVEEAKRISLATKSLSGGHRHDVAHISCTPWYGFTDVIQPLALEAGNAIPKVLWGKFAEVNGKTLIPFSITGHHGLLDGFHIGRLFEAIARVPEQ